MKKPYLCSQQRSNIKIRNLKAMNISIIRHIEESQKEEVLTLIHSSFKEHLGHGLKFTCSYYTLQDLDEKVLGGECFFAVKDNKIIGLISILVKDLSTEAYLSISAVHPQFKSLGVGSLLMKEVLVFLREQNVKVLISDTSINARNTVRWYVKKLGCRIVGYQSYPSTNYYSYIFRLDLVPVSFFTKHVKYPFMFIKSYLRCKITKRRNGQYTPVGKMLKCLFRK